MKLTHNATTEDLAAMAEAGCKAARAAAILARITGLPAPKNAARMTGFMEAASDRLRAFVETRTPRAFWGKQLDGTEAEARAALTRFIRAFAPEEQVWYFAMNREGLEITYPDGRRGRPIPWIYKELTTPKFNPTAWRSLHGSGMAPYYFGRSMHEWLWQGTPVPPPAYRYPGVWAAYGLDLPVYDPELYARGAQGPARIALSEWYAARSSGAAYTETAFDPREPVDTATLAAPSGLRAAAYLRKAYEAARAVLAAPEGHRGDTLERAARSAKLYEMLEAGRVQPSKEVLHLITAPIR